MGGVGMRVLVVEDEPQMFLEVEEVVLQEGGEVIGIATTLAEALELAPLADVALIDIRLGDGMAGPVIAKTLVNRFGIGVVYVTNSRDVPKGASDAMDGAEKPVVREAVRHAIQLAAAFQVGSRHTGPKSSKA